VDVSTRKLRYFVAVAEELHFSRAAARLFVAQQALSKQVRELESDVGVQLLRRTTRSVELTPAGGAFLVAARKALEAIDAGVESARRAALGDGGVLRLGFLVGGALELGNPIIAEFSKRFPGVRLDLREFGFTDPASGLADGSSDVAFVRLPVGVSEIDYVPLFVEPLVVGVATNHRFAERPSVSIDEMLSEPIVVGRTADDVWRQFWTLDAYRAGATAAIAGLSNSVTEEVAIVAAGVGCTVTAAGSQRYIPHPAIRYLPITGAEPSILVVAWPKGRRTALVDSFVEVALAVRDRETDILALIERPFAGAGDLA